MGSLTSSDLDQSFHHPGEFVEVLGLTSQEGTVLELLQLYQGHPISVVVTTQKRLPITTV